MTDSIDHQLWLPYCQMKTARPPERVVRSEGSILHLADGRQLIDGISSWWTACHGYNHPKIVAAICQQAQNMPHVMLGGLVHEPATRLAARLSQLIPGQDNRVFFSDSGSVAVEVALKMAAQYWLNKNVAGKNRFVCFQDSYHGDTAGAMSVCDPVDSMHSQFKGFLLEQFPTRIPQNETDFNAFRQFLEERKNQIAGVIIEPLIQMAAGFRFHSSESLVEIEKICREFDLIFITDEVATGFGRTGTMFALEQANLSPDIVCVGKGLTGGSVGLAATIATDKIYQSFHSESWENALMHGPTYMGNPIACAAANASLDLFEQEPRMAQVQALETRLQNLLNPMKQKPCVIDVRCRGAVGVVQLNEDAQVQSAIDFFVAHGCWIRPLRDTLYLAPSFTIKEEQVETLAEAINQYLDTI